MNNKRLKELAGLNEGNVDIKAAAAHFDKLQNILNGIQDEIYSMDTQDRNECLEMMDEAGDLLKDIKRKIAKYM